MFATEIVTAGVDTVTLPLRLGGAWVIRTCRGDAPAPLADSETGVRLCDRLQAALATAPGAPPPFSVVDPTRTRVCFSSFLDPLGSPLCHPAHFVSRSFSREDRSGTLHLNPRSALVARLAEDPPPDEELSSLAFLLLSLGSWPTPGVDCAAAMQPYWGARVVSGPMRLYSQPIDERRRVRGSGSRTSIVLEPSLLLDGREERLVSRWRERDAALTRELDRASRPDVAPPPGESLLTWSPLLPCALLGVSPAELATRDPLYGLSAFFGNPMVDRTGRLAGPLRTKNLDPLPSAEEIEAADESLATIVDARARQILDRAAAEGREVEIFWSGGIDSTAALVGLLRTCRGDERERLVVRCDASAIAEYPRFHQQWIDGALREERIDGDSVSRELDAARFSVTGECGDQIFGSAKMAACFGPGRVNGHRNHFRAGLDAPWPETLIPTLEAWGIVHDRAAWVDAITPQLEASPLPIRTTFDLLWWLNFSLKWQQVVLRFLNHRWEMLPGTGDPLAGVEHFFRAPAFERWACRPENHACKFADRRRWRSYKEPLKRVIREFTGDDAYYRRKEKVGSLARSTELPSGSALMGIDDRFQPITWGAHSICERRRRERHGSRLERLLNDPAGGAGGAPPASS